MRLIDSRKLKEYILTTYDQVDIFATYLDIPESDINYCLESKSNKISNPLRQDTDPSLGFMPTMDKETNAYKLKMYDFADPYYRGDCFDLVGMTSKLGSLNTSKALDFIAICKDIIHTMQNRTKLATAKELIASPKTEAFTAIHIEPRLWNGKDIDLWNSFGLPFNEIKHLIFPLKHSFISNFCDYTYTENDPGYGWISGYYDGRTLYKLYFPFRTGKEPNKPRFKTNNKYYVLECIHEIRPADILVITKSNKDKLLIKRLLPRIEKIHTIEITSFTSESVIISDNFAMKLYDIFPTVVTNVDFDYAGLRTSGEHKRRFGMIRFIPTNGRFGTYDFGGKDMCEIFRTHGEQYCIDVIQEAYNYLKQQLEIEN